MADEKKKTDSWDFDPIEALMIIILLAALASAIPTMWGYITSGELSFFGLGLGGVVDFFKNNIRFFKIFGYAAAGAAAVGTFVFNKRSDAIWAAERAKLYPAYMPAISGGTKSAPNPLETRWEKIVAKSNSENSSDWRWAIIEADIILDELLDKLQLPGSTMGEKLKAVEPSDFVTVELAWEAHKARNAVAHQGSNFLLNQRETRRIISLYEAVFKEFELI